jgi:site-specific recombinase
VPVAVLAVSALGVLAIGLINLVVSFTLALWVAMRSQRVRFVDAPQLMRRLLHRMRTEPASFFAPPRNATVSAAAEAA